MSASMPPHVKNITGLVSGRLVVLSYLGLNSDGKSIWKCRCEKSLGGCGEIAIVKGQYLTTRRTKSCGCLRRANGVKQCEAMVR